MELWQKFKTASRSYQLLCLALAALAVLNAVALPQHFYHTMKSIDIPAHFIFGIVIGAGTAEFFKSRTLVLGIFLTIIAALLLGTLWEAAEYLRDLYAVPLGFLPAQQGRWDTYSDTVVNILGAALAAGYLSIQKVTKAKEGINI